ncbi:unnamed protein product [Macrosiphum euphorbiae]|uniref:Uncharacterized protein n=1 Tax=Macrosiphum euphorbiae TaxID=13131 RepID=A0AAV0WQU3_9HEMI|nr:unnamed protein product [Macrosiphum euphorbiae]
MKETERTERKTRKKKIDVIPGRSVTSTNEDIPDKLKPMNQPSTSRGISSDYSVDDSEEDQNILSSSSDEDEENVVCSNVVKKAKCGTDHYSLLKKCYLYLKCVLLFFLRRYFSC